MDYRIQLRGPGHRAVDPTLRDRDAAIRFALRVISRIRPFQDDDAFNDYAALTLANGGEVCGVSLIPVLPGCEHSSAVSCSTDCGSIDCSQPAVVHHIALAQDLCLAHYQKAVTRG